MADFVAVIRKAVDGLANNTPEMRAKVYEKARGAVLRQLENMKPRPPEELLRRQMSKIDAAIAEVESEHAEAVESDEDEAIYADSSPQPEEHAYSDAPSAAVYEEAPGAVQPEEPEYEDTRDDAAARQAPDEAVEEYAPHAPAPEYQPAEQSYTPAHEHESEPVAVEAHEDHQQAEYDDRRADIEPVEAHEPVAAPEHYARSVPDNLYELPERPRFVDDGSPAAEDEWRHGVDDAAEPVRTPPSWTGDIDDGAYRNVTAYEDVAPQKPEYDAGGNWRDLPQEPVEAPAPVSQFESREAQFEENAHVPEDAYEPLPVHEQYVPEATVEAVEPANRYYDEPAVEEERAYVAPVPASGPAKAAAVEPGHFEEVAWDGLEPVSDKEKAPAKIEQTERSPWEDLEELIGYDGGKESGRVPGADKAATVGIFDDVAPVSYAQAKKKKRNYAAPVLALLGAALLAGGGYAVWLNRDAMNDMVGGLIQAAGPGETPPATTSTPPANQPASQTGQAPAGQSPASGGAENTIPGDDGAIEGNKFTQRLLANGGEVDEGEAGAPPAGQTVNGEGQSVARQNEAPPATTPEGTHAPQAGATAPSAAGATPPAGQTQAPPAAGTAVPAGAERVFLYEERLGQTVPTTLEGSVAWSLQEEPGANGAPEKTVQGRIEVPGRGLSAMITFRRNTDSSLPASHIVEIVFSVGAGFDGGAIESVQRIAMKQTEQDRGNALVAVPARITDDFHMIALNDFADARASNLELLRTRNWIDIPVTYRNGRRALLTMPKGPEGVKAFDAALSAWAAQPSTSQ